MSEPGPLNLDLNISKVKTGIPIIADNYIGEARFEKLDQTMVDGKGPSLKFTFRMTGISPDNEGGEIPKDFPVFVNVTLYDKNMVGEWSPEKVPEWAAKKINRILDALLGTGDEGNKKGKPERPNLSAQLVPDLVGKVALLKFKVKTGDYTGNDVIDFYFPADLNA